MPSSTSPTVYHIYQDYGFVGEELLFSSLDLREAESEFDDLAAEERPGVLELAYFMTDGTYEVIHAVKN